MARQQAKVDELCDDKKTFFGDSDQQSVSENSQSKPRLVLENTSVDCESTCDSGSRNRVGNDNSTRNQATISNVETSPRFSVLPVISSSVSSLSDNQSELTNKESQNLNLPTTTMIYVSDKKLDESEFEEASTGGSNRPRERIHFFTPEVEEKYRKIMEEVTREAEIASSEASRSPGRKRKLPSEIFIEPPEVPKETEDEIAASLGPIPAPGSHLFRGMSFVLSCGSRDFIDPHQLETMDSTDDVENEEQWTRKPFVRERLIEQLKAGGGDIYDNFELVPPEKYDSTMLITNIPNLTAKSLLCLSVGITTYNHQWIIRCCKERFYRSHGLELPRSGCYVESTQENEEAICKVPLCSVSTETTACFLLQGKIVNPAEEQLPAGWSLIKQSYVEMFQRLSLKPFLSATLPVVVVIPTHPVKHQFVSLWKRICQNAGAAVLLVKYPTDDFIEGTVVLTHSLCPSWLIEKATKWGIPLVSTRWAIQCLIEGQICSYDAHPSFDYNYVKKSQSSKISS